MLANSHKRSDFLICFLGSSLIGDGMKLDTSISGIRPLSDDIGSSSHFASHGFKVFENEIGKLGLPHNSAS
jgi:hypothetical protein